MRMNAQARGCANRVLLCSTMWLVIQTCGADEPAVTPYRPTVSTPAALSEPGWLELEAGGQRIKDGGGRRDSLPYTAKLAFSPNWGLRISGEAAIQQRDEDGSKSSGFGDTSLILKYRIPISNTNAFGVEAGFKSPTARRALGSGKADTLFNLIYSADFAAYRLSFGCEPNAHPARRRRPRTGPFSDGLGRIRLASVERDTGRCRRAVRNLTKRHGLHRAGARRAELLGEQAHCIRFRCRAWTCFGCARLERLLRRYHLSGAVVVIEEHRVLLNTHNRSHERCS
jgi:hypothetical protein